HMIQTLYNRLQRGEDDKPPLSPKTIRNVHGVLSKALNQAVLNEMIRLNPAQLTTLPRKVQKDIQTLTDEQIKQFFVVVERDSYRSILKFILFSGVRESEAIGLTWDCIDFERGTIRIYHQLLQRPKSEGGYTLASLKNDRERLLTPPPTLLALLKERKHEQMQQRMKAGLAWHGWGS
ncbi:tyrosine-type recombinase/integrase, partial [Oscillibacter valericigenes]|nr:tyrosine-type recombinase/integrase [Oscillibacter valericigenes]